MTQHVKKIGLLGGSFNPAHDGHLHISHCAIEQLALDELWWLVSPQNPLKSSDDMAPFQQRFDQAAALALPYKEIKVSADEKQFGTQYTSDTLEQLQGYYADHSFVWLMGADNWQQIHHWHHWQNIFSRVPVVVFDREPYGIEYKACEAARIFSDYEVTDSFKEMAVAEPPAWCFLPIIPHSASSTEIRKNYKKW